MTDIAQAVGRFVQLARPSRRTPPRLIAAAFEREALFGIRLATFARIVGTAIILVWLMTQNWAFGTAALLYLVAILAGFVGLGVAHLILARATWRRPWQAYVFVVLDVAMVAYVISRPNPFHPFYEAIPPAVMLRFENFTYFFVLLASVALLFSPRLLLFFGVVTGAFWAAAVAWVAAQPRSFTASGAINSLDPEVWLLDLLNPNYVNIESLIMQLVVVGVTSATVALAVWRARRLVRRQVEVERERTNLARYFSPNMVEELARTDRPLGTPRRQNAAVLFADIVGFTRLSETLAPEHIMALLRDYHSRMATAVFAHDGTLDKFIGDEVMATFGTPTPGSRDAANALSCALAMQEAIALWNRERRQAGALEIKVGIGVHYGPVVLGDIGAEQRFEFAVIGDTVNVASRLERLTRELDVEVLAGDALVRELRHELGSNAEPLLKGFSPTPGHSLRGRREAVDAWALARRDAIKKTAGAQSLRP